LLGGVSLQAVAVKTSRISKLVNRPTGKLNFFMVRGFGSRFGVSARGFQNGRFVIPVAGCFRYTFQRRRGITQISVGYYVGKDMIYLDGRAMSTESKLLLVLILI